MYTLFECMFTAKQPSTKGEANGDQVCTANWPAISVLATKQPSQGVPYGGAVLFSLGLCAKVLPRQSEVA